MRQKKVNGYIFISERTTSQIKDDLPGVQVESWKEQDQASAYYGSLLLIYTKYAVSRSDHLFACNEKVEPERFASPLPPAKKGWFKRPCTSCDPGLVYMNGEHRVCPPIFVTSA